MNAVVLPFKNPLVGVSHSSAAYAFITDSGEVLYIGASNQLNYRLSGHSKRKLMGRSGFVLFIEIDQPFEVEKTLLRAITTDNNHKAKSILLLAKKEKVA